MFVETKSSFELTAQVIEEVSSIVIGQKEFTNVINAMVIQSINHALNDGTGFISLCHVRIAAEDRLFGS